jgi:hypothetical protein
MAWILVPCLVQLRAEFNAVAPNRGRGADGSIGDSSHTSSSDHTPDEDSDVLRDHDADDKNEVHALDIDSTGPWPEAGWFDRAILALVDRERTEYESATMVGRLQYVIWNRRIASRSWGWTWRTYTGSDPHTNHAHFSARYLTSTEADTRPWGIEDDMPLTSADGATVWKTDIIPNPAFRADAKDNPATTAFFAVGDIWRRVGGIEQTLTALTARVAQLVGADLVDEAAIVSGVLAELTPAAIAAAIPPELARQVADELAARLAS